MIKWVKRIAISSLILISILLVIVHTGMRTISYSDDKTYTTFSNSGIDAEIIYSDIGNIKVRTIVESKQTNDSVLIVFVHGAPASWNAFKEYMLDSLLSSKARLISYDRPGYGNSSPEAMPNIIEQAEILKHIIDTYRLPNVMLVGHSYGCPIVGYASTIPNNKIDKTVLIAPVIDPASEPIFWFSYFAHWTLTKYLLPNAFQTAGIEKFSHAENLAKIKNNWQNTTSTITLIHGMEDEIAPPKENIEFANNNIPKDKLNLHIFEDRGHLILFNYFNTVRDIILAEKESL